MRGAVREFVPGRIRTIDLTKTVFLIDPAFRIEDYLSHSLGDLRDDEVRHTVRLRFTGTAVRYVRERLWHPSQQAETTPEGDWVVSFEVSHLREAERLALTWAPDCEALAPPELRESIAKALTEAAKLHRPSDAAGKAMKRKR